MEKQFQIEQNGQQVQQQDLNLLGEVAGLADDRVFAELFRMAPYNGVAGVSRGILPYGIGAVVSGDSTTGRVRVQPFRAFVGSRTAEAADAKMNWRDIRSAVVVGTTTLQQTASIAANSSGDPRWDLVYAAVVIDANSAAELRKVKDPTTKVVTEQSVTTTLATSVSLGVVTGTTAASPDWPTIPADSGTTYYIPLAYVRVPDGFNATSQVLDTDIAEQAPILNLATSTGASTLQVADQHYKAGSILTPARIQAWGASGTRPAIWMPPTMKGGETLLLYIDFETPVHARGTVLDSRDWSKRLVRWTAAIDRVPGTAPWMGGDGAPNAVTSPPSSISGFTYSLTGIGQTVSANLTNLDAGENGSLVMLFKGTETDLADATEVGIWCDFDDGGKLKVHHHVATPPGAYAMFVWLEFTAPFHNAGV